MSAVRPDLTDEMIIQAVNDGLSNNEIANKFDLTASSVQLRLRKLNLTARRQSGVPRFKSEDIQFWFDKGYGITKTAKELGISESGLFHWVRKYNLKSVHEYKSECKDKWECTICGDLINRILFNERGTCRMCNRTQCRRFLKKKLIEYKGGKCSECGYSGSIGAMDFHHTHDKDDSLTNFLTKCLKMNPSKQHIELLFNELEKCVLLCSNCHRERHCQDYVSGKYDEWYEQWYENNYSDGHLKS